MTQDFNPLMDFARKIECSVKIPTNGNWYNDDVVEFNAINEVDIQPMLPVDELNIVNPELLISGKALLDVIKSCCPSVKKVEELFYPDVNSLLLGIKKATYGDVITQESVCPKCNEKKTNMETEKVQEYINERYNGDDSKLTYDQINALYEEAKKELAEKITQMEKNNEIKITPQSYNFNIDELLNRMTFLPKDSIVETENGLKIHMTPYKCIDKIKFSNRNIQQSKILQKHKEQLNNITEDLNESADRANEIVSMYTKLTDTNLELLSLSVKYIELPNGDIVDNKSHIIEFIKNSKSELIIKLNDKIIELNQYGIPQTLKLQCECCGHEWDEKFYGFNQTDFFGTGS